MQGSLYYYEGDDAGTVRVNVSSSRVPSAAAAAPRGTRCFSGQVAVAEDWCRVLWWSDPADDSLHLFTVPTSNAATHFHSAAPRHVVLTYAAPACGVIVQGAVDHGRLKLTIGWCSPFAELFVSEVTVVRDGGDNSVTVKYVKSVVAALDLGGNKSATSLTFLRHGATDAAASFLVSSASDVWSIHVDERGGANESLLYRSSTTIFAIAAAADLRTLFVATGAPQVVRVLDLNNVNSKSNTGDLTLPGRDVQVRSLVPSPCGSVVYAVAYDTVVGCDCVITLSKDAPAKRVSGLGSMSVASVAADVNGPQFATIAWSQSPAMPRAPIETGADGVASPTTIHCTVLQKQPFHVDVSATRAAMVVPTLNGSPSLLLMAGSSPRCRVIAVTSPADTVALPRVIMGAYRASQATSGRTAGDAGVFAVSAAAPEAPTTADVRTWHAAIEAGSRIVNAVGDGPELLRQIIATAVARPHNVANCAAFTRLVATARALGATEAIASRVIEAAAVNLLSVSEDGGASAAFVEKGVWLAASTRFRAALLAADLHRRLTALIFVRVCWFSCAADSDAAGDATARALLHVASAIAVLRAAGHHLEALVPNRRADVPLHVQVAAALLPQQGAHFNSDVRIVALGFQLQSLPSVASGIKAVAAWSASWMVDVPVMRHFAINEIMAKHGGLGASSALIGNIQAVSDAIMQTNSDVVADVLDLLVGCSVLEKEGWVATLLHSVDSLLHRQQLAALAYRVFVLRELVQESGNVSALTADHMAALHHDAQALLALVSAESHPSHDALHEPLADLVLDSTIYLCRAATAKEDFVTALQLLQRMATVPAAATELYVEENTLSITTSMAEKGAMRDINHALITDPTVSKGIATCLYELAKNPKTLTGDRDARETRRLQCTSAAITFLTSRGALGSAAKVAYEVAAGMRSAVMRGPLTLERAHSIMSVALNTLQVIPPHAARAGRDDGEAVFGSGNNSQRNWSADTPMQREATTAFSVDGQDIGQLSPADLPEVTRRCHQLACEAKLVHTTAVNCAPWAAVESIRAPADVKAAEDTMKELIRARLWTDALLMADLWQLDADVVLRSWVADLLEAPSSSSSSGRGADPYDGRWGQILDVATARSTTANHHSPLRLLLSVCLSHAKYRDTPAALKKTLLQLDTQAVLATMLAVPRPTASLTEEALQIATDYCELMVRKERLQNHGMSEGVISTSLLDRLAGLARKARASGEGIADLDDRKRERLVAACAKYLDVLPKYVSRK